MSFSEIFFIIVNIYWNLSTNLYKTDMLITYEDSKEPVIVYKDQLFVQNRYKDKIKFNPRNLLFLTLSSPQLWQLTDKDIFVPHQKMTQDYQVYKKLQSEKEKMLPLLRQTLTDSSLPDINYFPMGDYEISPGVSTQTITPYGWKSEFLRWISWLGDKKAIPQIRELLFHTEDPLNFRDMPLWKNSPYIKNECIKALGNLWAKNVLFEYLLQEKNPQYRYIQNTLTELMQLWLTDTDLPSLMKLCERYESLDKPANELFEYYLEKLFWEGWRVWSMRSHFFKWVLHDWDSDAPVQWLVCKAVSRIGTQKSVEFLEYIYQHTVYYELHKSALIGIRHRAFLQQDAFRHNISQVSATLIEKIYKQYCNFDSRNMLVTPIQYAMTDAADSAYQESSRKREKQERIEAKNELAKRAEYFKTLKPWDIIGINSPFVYYDEKKLMWTIIENDWETLLIESQFNNKTKIGRRKFLIRNWLSNWPVCFMDDGWWKQPHFYSLHIPQAEKKESHNLKSWDIRVRIPEISNRWSENDYSVF